VVNLGGVGGEILWGPERSKEDYLGGRTNKKCKRGEGIGEADRQMLDFRMGCRGKKRTLHERVQEIHLRTKGLQKIKGDSFAR